MDKANQGAPAARNTPGPWLPDGDYIRYGERPPDAGKVGWPAIAKALTVKAKRIEERRANVALLAAAPVMADALSILARRDVKAAVAFLLARNIELPHVAWSAKEDERSGEAYERAGSFEDDARYIDPAREDLWSAVAEAALSLAGREANNLSAAPAAPSNSKEQP